MSSTKHTTGGTAKIATEHPIKAKIASSVVDCDSGKITEDEVVKHEPSSPVTRKAPFRFRWQKKLGNTGQPVAAAGNERFYSRPRTSTRRVANELKVEDNFEAEYQDDEDDEDGDEYFVGEDGCDSSIDINDQVEGGAKMSSGRGTDKSRANDGIASTLSSRPRPDKNDPARPQNNGRVFGRKLVPWHRPRMVEKLLMHLMYESHRVGIKLPWDQAVTRLCPGSTGQTAVQMLQKLRDILIAEGHMVPPLMGKGQRVSDKNIRGYVRDMSSTTPTDVKVLCWGDPWEDRKENLIIPDVVRGSGNYKKLEKYQPASSTTVEKLAKPTDGSRRNRLPAEVIEAAKQKEAVETKRKAERRSKRNTLKANSSKKSSSTSSTTARGSLVGESDDEYKPGAKRAKASGRKRARRSTKKFESSDDDDHNDFDFDSHFNFDDHDMMEDDESIAQPLNNLPVVISEWEVPELHKQPSAEIGHNSSSSFSDYDYDDDEEEEEPVENPVYQGPEIHGTPQQWLECIEHGIDPTINGTKFYPNGLNARFDAGVPASQRLLPDNFFDTTVVDNGQGSMGASAVPLNRFNNSAYNNAVYGNLYSGTQVSTARIRTTPRSKVQNNRGSISSSDNSMVFNGGQSGMMSVFNDNRGMSPAYHVSVGHVDLPGTTNLIRLTAAGSRNSNSRSRLNVSSTSGQGQFTIAADDTATSPHSHTPTPTIASALPALVEPSLQFGYAETDKENWDAGSSGGLFEADADSEKDANSEEEATPTLTAIDGDFGIKGFYD